MKKGIKKILLVLVVVALSMGTIACGTTITGIKWSKMPASEYVLDKSSTVTTPEFAIEVLFDNNTSETITQTKAEVSVTNFSLATPGTRRMTVSYDKFSLYFDYTVTDPNAKMQGEGTAASPYQISNAQQFMLIMLGDQKKGKDVHYKLTNDIDFSGVDTTAYHNALFVKDANGKFPIFEGTIDGGKYTAQGEYTNKNYQIMNYNAPSSAPYATKRQPGLFFLLGNCNFQRLDLVNFKLFNTAAEGAGLFGVGQYSEPETTVSKTDALTYSFKDINVKNSTMNVAKNSSFFVGYTYHNIKMNVENCTIDSSSKLLATREAGGFIGSNNGNTADSATDPAFTFKNCTVAATMSAQNIGALIANNSNEYYYTAENCTYSGKSYITGAYDKLSLNETCDRAYDSYLSGFGKMTGNCVKDVGNKNNATYYTLNTYTGSNPFKKEMMPTNPTVVTVDGLDKVTFNKVDNAVRYVVSYSFVVNGSSAFVTEEVAAAQLGTNSTYTTNLARPLQVYTAGYAAEKAIKNQLEKGIYVLEKYPSTKILLSGGKGAISYSVTAYNAQDIAVGGGSGLFTNKFIGGYGVNATNEVIQATLGGPKKDEFDASEKVFVMYTVAPSPIPTAPKA